MSRHPLVSSLSTASTVFNTQPPHQPIIASSPASDLGPQAITKLITAAPTSAAVLQLVCSHHRRFDGINTVTALHRAVKHLKPADKEAVLGHPGYAQLLPLVAAHAPALAARGAANALYALAKLPVPPQPQLLNALIASLRRTLLDMGPQHVSNSVWALAHMRHHPGADVLSSIASKAADIFADMQNQVSA